MAKQCKVFISYSHEDEMLKDSKVKRGAGYPKAFLFRLYAAIAAHDDLLTKDEIFFDDERLAAEPAWRPAIETALDECGLLIFLVSPHSVISDFCMTKEVARAMERGINVITVLLRPSHDWYKVKVRNPTTGETKALGEWHSGGLPKFGGNARPVSDWGDEEEAAWNNAVKHIVDFMQANPVTRQTTASNAVAVEPLPEWPPEEAAFLADCRRRLVVCFRDQVLRSRLGFIFEQPEQDLPATIQEALGESPQELGQSVCVALLNLADDLTLRLKERSLAFSSGECAVLTSRLKTAMGAGARMCLDPKVLDELGLGSTADRPVCRRVPANEMAGATLALRKEPNKTWEKSSGVNSARLEDSCAIPVPIELGDKASVEKGLAELVFAHIYPGKDVPADMDATTIDRMRGDLNLAAIRKFTRYFVFPQGHTALLTPEQETWVIDRLATGVLVLQSGTPSPSLFRYDERSLLSLINAFLNVFDEPEWNPS